MADVEDKHGLSCNSLIEKAIEFAAYAHRNQTRKGTEIPYISHPYAVGMILLKAGCKEEVVAAGILHDTLEDTETTDEQLLELFGSVVFEIVMGCSEPDKGATWEERKQHTLEALKTSNLAIRQVTCADKLHNIRSIRRDLEQYGEETWKRFKRGRESQEWYYTGLIESLGYASRFPLLDELQDEIEQVFGAPLAKPEWSKLRYSQKFIDLAFETAYGNLSDIEERQSKFVKLGAWDLIQHIHKRAYPLYPEYQDDFDMLITYLQERGIEFEFNSEGPAILVGFCTVLMSALNMYPHEVFHHFKRGIKRGIL